MSKIFTFLLIIAVLIFGYVLFGGEKDLFLKEKKNSVKTEKIEKVEKVEVLTGEPAPVSPAENISETTFSDFIKTEPSKIEFGLNIQAPTADMTVASPFFVQGRAKGGDSIAVRILNFARKVLIEEKISLKASPDSDGYRPFQVKLNYEFVNTREGFLEVALINEKGEEKNQQEMPLKFL